MLPVGDADDGLLVVLIQIHDEVGRLEGPQELHTPFRVGIPVVDPSPGRHTFLRSVEGALAEGVGGFDDPLVGEPVGFQAIVRTILTEEGDGDGDEPDHIPIPHEALEIHFAVHGLQWWHARARAAAEKGQNEQRGDAMQSPDLGVETGSIREHLLTPPSLGSSLQCMPSDSR
jgi:hypothetical protein